MDSTGRPDILITSFATWLPHQASNASDDLLLHFLETSGKHYTLLRHLPVDHVLAPLQLIDAVDRLHPRMVVCCGMAEERTGLSAESQAVMDGTVLRTGLDLQALTKGLEATSISNDAGDFVCNTLYFRCLEHRPKAALPYECLFIHVPVLTAENTPPLLKAFRTILERLERLTPPRPSSR